jgi:hypothetical protein
MDVVRRKSPKLLKLNSLDDDLNTAPDPGSDGPRLTSSVPIYSDDVVPSTARRLSSRLSSLAGRLDRVRKSPRRDNFVKMTSVESLDLTSAAAPIGPNLGAYSSQSLERDETLDDYFESTKKFSSQRRCFPDQPEHDLELSFNTSASRDSAIFAGARSLGARSVASGNLTVQTEPALRLSTSKNKKRSKRSKSRSSSSKGRDVCAQLCFEEGRAYVEFAHLPRTNQEKADRKEAGQAHMPQVERVIKSLSSMAA